MSKEDVMTRVVLLLSLLLASPVFAQPVPTSVPQKPTGDEAAVRDVHARFAAAWNQHDAAGLAALMRESADYTEPDGRTAFGRAEIEKLFGLEHGSVFKMSELHLAIERVRFLDDRVSLVDGSYELFKARDTKGTEI